MNYYQHILEKVFNLERLSWDELSQVPEFKLLINNIENQKWHGEKYTDAHIDLMLDLFFNHNEYLGLNDKEAVAIYLTILFHDIAKPLTLSIGKDGHYHNYGHEQQGSRLIWDFVNKADQPLSPEGFETILLTSKLSFWHMFKNEKDWKCNRAKYCVSSFSPDELKLLALFHIIDTKGAIRPDKKDFIPFVNAKLRLEVADYIPTKKNPVFNLLIGPSGSGKSTLAAKLNLPIVSTDVLRQQIHGDASCQSNHELIFGTAQKEVRKILESGSSVIFDATNLSYKHRKNFVEIAKKLEVPVYQWVFLTPLQQCLDNQLKRERQVPEDVVKKQYKTLELPCFSEATKVFYLYQGKIYER